MKHILLSISFIVLAGVRCAGAQDPRINVVATIPDLAEFARPHERSPAQHADWLDLMARTAGEVLEVPLARIYMKHRDRQRGAEQYQKVDERGARLVVHEGGLKFVVNLSDYVDTGLFLDHRITRQMVREAAAGKRFVNLFGYTGSFTVYAAAGDDGSRCKRARRMVSAAP